MGDYRVEFVHHVIGKTGRHREITVQRFGHPVTGKNRRHWENTV